MDVVTEAKACLELIERGDSECFCGSSGPGLCVCDDARWPYFKKCHDSIANLLSIVKRLPVTADGVRVLPGDTVYDLAGNARSVTWDAYGTWSGYWVASRGCDARGKPNEAWLREVSAPCRVDKVYSTRAAAEAAREGE